MVGSIEIIYVKNLIILKSFFNKIDIIYHKSINKKMDSINKEIWISSHITQIEGLNYLNWCIESTLPYVKQGAQLVISASGLLPKNIDNIILYKHEKRLSQFEHIKFIWSQRKDILSEDTIILFLDDDDMLLQKSDTEYIGCKQFKGYMELTDLSYKFSDPFEEILSDPNIPGLTGLQILGWSEIKDWSNITIDKIPLFLEDYKRELVSDFSGTVIRKKYLDQYLSKLKISDKSFDEPIFNDIVKVLGNLTDVMFMNFIEKLPLGREANNVTIFHRMKSYQSEWQIL